MKKTIIACCVSLALVVSGCSATSALTGLIGSKPDVTAQAGAENTKQTLGLNSKIDQSSKSDNTIKDSSVGAVDSSNAKRVNASSITADMIKADKIEIRNNESYAWEMAAGMFVVGLMVGALAVTIYATRRKNKGA
ncbi:Rz-like spanin [Enterobacter phage Ec_L1]|uniref:Spanin n=1 Tax=Enterobacter phage Ec_L1 TaxID=2070180 RepID=A0A2P0W9T6_9CAUD|nr:Rz-like spanin [Enterobacter phage Ec_L1]AUV57128.1 hypothetical protein Ec14 [Enterobacter phage Ec_L1]